LVGCSQADLVTEGGTADQPDELSAEGADVHRWEQEPGVLVLEDFGWAADVGGNDREAVQHALQDDHAEGFVAAGDNQDVGSAVPGRDPAAAN